MNSAVRTSTTLSYVPVAVLADVMEESVEFTSRVIRDLNMPMPDDATVVELTVSALNFVFTAALEDDDTRPGNLRDDFAWAIRRQTWAWATARGLISSGGLRVTR